MDEGGGSRGEDGVLIEVEMVGYGNGNGNEDGCMI